MRIAEEACLREGTKLTELRRTVLSLVLEAEKPPTAYELLNSLSNIRKATGPPTIYRALDFLLGMNLIHKVERLNAFITCVEPGRHTHPVQLLICDRCGAVTEVEDEGVSEAIQRVAKRLDFHPRIAVVEVSGICADCARQS